MSLSGSKKADSLLARVLRAGLAGLVGITALAGSSAGCLDRPVSPASPNTTNVFVQDIKQSTVDKIDLLFMIDNSISMADKQQILADAVPQLVSRLIKPAIDPVTQKEEFKPVVDIHIGVISSSIGGHGGDICSTKSSSYDASQTDNAHLIGSVRPSANLQSYNSLGFLWWDPTGQKATPPGEGNEGALVSNFAAHVTATGENGCGYEASLEAWYRFLVDPAPPKDVVVTDNVANITGVDDVVLQQRKDFLRQDSLVAIIMLSDENDCSIIDGGVNWIAAQITNPNNTPFNLPRATAACASDANSACCRSCASSEGAPPPGCGAIADDPECAKGNWDDVGDHPNLRCFQQKKRFGIDFLYPTRRYVEALTQPTICPAWDGNGPIGCNIDNRVPNPLFNNSPDGAGAARDPGLIYIAGIVGVPWQDIATDDSVSGAGLDYLTAAEITAQGRWDWLVPQCKEPVADQLPRAVPMCHKWDLNDQPDDALMVESSLPRSGTGGLGLTGGGVPIADVNAGAMAHPINGHEWNTADADLQYACIFPLGTPRDCTATTLGCDCDANPAPDTVKNPLCQAQGGAYSTLQVNAKAFPGVRQLQVLKDFGANSIVASICPKVSTGDKNDPSYGYNPAVAAIIERLKEVLAGQCVNRPIDLPKTKNGQPCAADDPDPACLPDPTKAAEACAIVEVAQNAGGGCGACDPSLNRSAVDPKLVKPVLERLKVTGQCGPGLPACDPATWCMCEIGVATDVNSCLNDVNSPAIGWCYIDATDPQNPIGNGQLVQDCTPARQIRFVGSNTPASGSTVFIACLGAPLTTSL